MVSENRIELSGRPARYLEAGAGWPLVLLHAFPLNADMWRPQLEKPLRGWRFIAPDLRGFGGSPPDADAHPTMDDFASDVVALLDHLEIERALIGGLSMGGYVMFAMVRAAPERFSGLVLADTRAPADTADGRAGRDAMSELVRTKGVEAVADQMIPKLLGETTRRTRPRVEAEVRRIIVSNQAAGIDGAIYALKNRPDSSGDLRRISTPTLVLVGDEDVVTPMKDAEALHAAIPRSQLVVLPKAGHLSSLESSADFSEALQNFVLSNL